MKPILVVGSANQDTNLRVERFPKPGETVMAHARWTAFGGKGANQAVAAAKLGATVSLIARIGQDDTGDRMLSDLGACGVDTRGVERDTGFPTGTAEILVDRNGENMIVADSGANRGLDEKQVDRHEALFAAAGLCVVQCEIPIATVLHVLALCRRMQLPVLFNPSPVFTGKPRLLAGIRYLVPNEIELQSLFPDAQDGLTGLAARALEYGIENVLVTRGPAGCLLVTREGASFYPALQVDSLDTTGAGDTFLGAFAAALSRGEPEERTIRYANAAAGIAVSRQGTWEAMPTDREVRDVFEGGRALWYHQ